MFAVPARPQLNAIRHSAPGSRQVATHTDVHDTNLGVGRACQGLAKAVLSPGPRPSGPGILAVAEGAIHPGLLFQPPAE